MKKTLFTISGVLVAGALLYGSFSFDKDSTRRVVINSKEYAIHSKIDDKITPTEVKEYRTQSSYTEKINRNTFRLVSYPDITFYRDGEQWYQVDPSEKIASNIPTAFADTVFSGAGDGFILDTGAVWATVHADSAGTTADATLGTGDIARTNINLGFAAITRGFYPFDTNSIPSSATLVSASLNIFITAKDDFDDDGDDWMNVVQTSQASETTLATGDYDQAGTVTNPTEGATRLDVSSGITTSAYNVWTLNATGLGWIKKVGQPSNCGDHITGWTCLGMREGHDAINDPPQVGGVGMIGQYSETSGTSGDPFLTVTFTVPNSPETIIWMD